MGHQIYVFPESTIYHVGGATLDKISPQKTFLNFRNNLSLIYKNIPQEKLYIVLFKRAFLDLVAAITFIFSGGFSHFGAVVKAYFAFYKSLKKIRIKRKAIPQKSVSCIFQKSIVKDFYLRKKKNFSALSNSDFS